MLKRLTWWWRYRRHLRSEYAAKRYAGYRVSEASYQDMQERARAYADGCGG
jgi:hypothetical protein